jgi:hypothetical protein
MGNQYGYHRIDGGTARRHMVNEKDCRSSARGADRNGPVLGVHLWNCSNLIGWPRLMLPDSHASGARGMFQQLVREQLERGHCVNWRGWPMPMARSGSGRAGFVSARNTERSPQSHSGKASRRHVGD